MRCARSPGCVFDVLDTDPRNGGLPSRQGLLEAGLLPSVYGFAFTPHGRAGTSSSRARIDASETTCCPASTYWPVTTTGKGRCYIRIAPTVGPYGCVHLGRGAGPGSTRRSDRDGLAAFLAYVDDEASGDDDRPPARAVRRTRTDRAGEPRTCPPPLRASAVEVTDAPNGTRNVRFEQSRMAAGRLRGRCRA